MASWPTSPFAHPQGSFNLPVPAPVPTGADCFTLQVQFPAEWLPYILAALEQLTLQATWQGARSEVEELQSRASYIISLFAAATCAAEPPPGNGGEGDDDMSCPCWRIQNGMLQFKCCGEWTDVMAVNSPSNPTNNQPQPEQGGGTAEYCFKLPADGKNFLPTTVSSGDTLLISALDGAVNDGDSPFSNLWLCGTGQRFLTTCLPITQPAHAGAPIPSGNDFELIALIGTTYYRVLNLDASFHPQVFTVPSGHTDDPVTFLLNNDNPSGDAGDITYCVTVTNNKPKRWKHTITSVQSPLNMDAIPYPPAGATGPTYATGSAWTGQQITSSGTFDTLCGILASWVTPTTILSVEVAHDSDTDNGDNHGLREVHYNDTGYAGTLYGALSTGAGTFDETVSNVVSGVTSLAVYNDRSDHTSYGNDHITKVIVEGEGFDPFPGQP